MSEVYSAGVDAFTGTFLKGELEFEGKQVRAAGGTRAPEGKDWWLIHGPKMVHAYYQWRTGNPNLVIWHTPDGTPAIELEVNIDLGDGTPLKAFIDRVFMDVVTGELIIVDLKSGKNAPSSSLQLAVYRLCLEKQFGVSPKHGAYWMGRTGTLDRIHDLEAMPPKMVESWMRTIRKQIVDGCFVPRLSKDCSWCSLRSKCYAYNPAVPAPVFESAIAE